MVSTIIKCEKSLKINDIFPTYEKENQIFFHEKNLYLDIIISNGKNTEKSQLFYLK